MVKVAVIDSGVHVAHPHISAIAGGVSIGLDGAVELNSFVDRVGHGTAVMAAIQEKAPQAEYFAVRVFHDSLRTSSRALVRAIEWSVEQRMDIVNLSLGTLNAEYAEPFRRVIDTAVAAGVTLVAAREMGDHACYPGSLGGVLGVSLDESCDREQYRVRGSAFLASGYPRPAPGIPKERNLQGISFAVANMSGFAARALDGLEIRSVEALRQALMANAHIEKEP